VKRKPSTINYIYEQRSTNNEQHLRLMFLSTINFLDRAHLMGKLLTFALPFSNVKTYILSCL